MRSIITTHIFYMENKLKKKGVNWIKCKDRLPEDGERVLTFGDCGIKISLASKVYGAIRFYGTAFDVTPWAYLNNPKGK